ncbi:MAG: hypothetical protein WCG47_07605, partial [Dermatophilaceae bacterium]
VYLFAAPLSQAARAVDALRAKVESEGPAQAAPADAATIRDLDRPRDCRGGLNSPGLRECLDGNSATLGLGGVVSHDEHRHAPQPNLDPHRGCAAGHP